MRILVKLLMVGAWVLFFLAVILTFTSSFKDEMFSASVRGFAIQVLIVSVVMTFLYRWIIKGQRDAFEKYVARVGPVKYLEHQHATGIAVTKDGLLVVSAGKETRSYRPNQIREWRTGLYDQNILTPSGRLSDLNAVGQEYRRHTENTGLFITVKDIEHPEWHIKIRDKKTLAKWFEILNQELIG